MSTHHQLTELIEYYQDYCKARGLRHSTIIIYKQHLLKLANYCPTLDLFNQFAVQRMFNDSRDRGNRGVTIHQAYRTVRTFSRWLADEEITETDKLAKLKPPRIDHRQKTPPSDPDIDKLLSTCKGIDILTQRDRCIILLLLDTGMRIGELVNLKKDDLKPEGILLTETKGRRDRYAFITDSTRTRIERYLSKRTDNYPALFLNAYSRPITRNCIQQVFDARSKLAGVHISPHQLRRAAATAWAEAGCNLEVIRQLLGHADLETTQLYLGIRPEALKVAHSQVSYVNRLNKK